MVFNHAVRSGRCSIFPKHITWMCNLLPYPFYIYEPERGYSPHNPPLMPCRHNLLNLANQVGVSSAIREEDFSPSIPMRRGDPLVKRVGSTNSANHQHSRGNKLKLIFLFYYNTTICQLNPLRNQFWQPIDWFC